MKKIYIHMMMLAAMVVAGAAMTSCQKEEVVTGKFTMTVNATKGGGNAKYLDLEGHTLNATWAEGEEVTVYRGEEQLGTLTAQTAGESTTLNGTLDRTVAVNDVLTLKFCSDNYNGQDGTLEYIAANCDYATASVTVASVGDGIVTTTGSADFVNQQAIVKFTLQKSDGTALPANPSAFTVNDGTSDVVTLTSIPAATYTNPNNGDGVLYVALPAVSDKPITLTATVGDDTYTYTTSSNKTFANGRYYEITVGMTKQAPAETTVTWTESDMSEMFLTFDGMVMMNNTHQDITVTASGGSQMDGWFDNNIRVNEGSGTITFTSSVGNIKSIVITAEHISIYEWEPPTGWTVNEMYPEEAPRTLSWSGTASATVNLDLAQGQHIVSISSVVFTIE